MTIRDYTRTLLTLTAVLGLCFGTAQMANADIVLNHSFEDGTATLGGVGTVPDWVIGSNAGGQYFNPGNASQIPLTTDGVKHAYTNAAASGGGSVSQITSTTIAAGETYTLTVNMGQVSNFSDSRGTFYLYGGTTGIGTALSNTNGTASQVDVIALNQSTLYKTDLTVTYTALASGDPFEGELLGIYLAGGATLGGDAGGPKQVLWDNVRLDSTSAIPEPGSLALFGLGSVMMLVRRRRG